MSDCIFCKIAKKEIPASVVYENDSVVVFKDISPVAPVHVLIIPKQHVASVNDLDDTNAPLVADIHLAARKAAELLGVAQSGYRLINNCGKDAGQTVHHLHYHLIGGVEMGAKLI